MPKTSYRFVHLSDIHFGQEWSGTLVVHEDARDQLIRDCREVANRSGAADGILITGDIAFRGSEEEFKKGGEWVEKLASAVGCEITAVRVIPGNHDIDRKRVDKHCRISHTHLRRGNADAVDGELEELNAVEEGNSLLPKVQAYREFAARYGCDFQSVRNPIWRKDYPLGPHYRLALVGMNSVQVCDDEDDLGKMVLGNAQYILRQEDNVEYIVLVHHPLVWFMERPNASRYLKRARVVMVGAWAPKTPAAAVERIRELLPEHEYAANAARLNAEGFRTAKGLTFDFYSVGYIARRRGWGRSAARQPESDV